MPDYPALLRFLLEPLLESPESLIIHQEITAAGKKVWLRVTFHDSQKGRIFGRGGRTIHAIRQVLLTAAAYAGQTLRLDIGEAPVAKSAPPATPNDKPIRKAKPPLQGSR